MAATAPTIAITGLGKRELSALRKQAKSHGVSPESYAKELIRNGLALESMARTTSFDELLRPVREQFERSGMTEAELDRLADEARTRHHKAISRNNR